MKRYEFWVEIITSDTIEVEAETLEEAIEEAYKQWELQFNNDIIYIIDQQTWKKL